MTKIFVTVTEEDAITLKRQKTKKDRNWDTETTPEPLGKVTESHK